MSKRHTHSVKSDRYISVMITSNAAKAGSFIRIPKLLIPILSILFVGVIAVIALFYVRFDTLTASYADATSRIQTLELEKANTEAHLSAELIKTEESLSAELARTEESLSAEISEKDTLISDLLVSLEEKEEQLNNIELQAEEMWNKLEALEAIKDSIYDKLNEAPADIYEDIESESTVEKADPNDISASADITPYNVTVSMSAYDGNTSVADTANAKTDSFLSLYEELLAKFSVLEASIETSYSDLSQLADMTDAYIPYAESVPSGYPIKGSHITCEYGSRIDPVTGKKNAYHYGLDFSASYRQDIFATAPGTVIFSGWNTDFGYNIIIDHGYGYTTRYAHLSKLYVKKGATVLRGDRIGGAGSTGKSTAVHLHYEVHLNDVRVNPSLYLD